MNMARAMKRRATDVPAVELVDLARGYGGFTWDCVAGELLGLPHGRPVVGYGVSRGDREVRVRFGTRRDPEATLSVVFIDEMVRKYVEANVDLLGMPGYYLGGWVTEEDSGKYLVLDVTVLFSDLKLAMSYARMEDQTDVYDFRNEVCIKVAS